MAAESVKVEIDNMKSRILFNVTKIIYRVDFLIWTAYHEINVHVHGDGRHVQQTVV